MTPGVECHGVDFRYPRGFELGPISLRLEPGVTCLVGPNGAGKSTFFRILAGLQRPRSGRVEMGVGTKIGYLPQSVELPGHATCEEVLHYVAWVQAVHRKERSAAVTAALESVGLADQRSSRVRTLSGGMQRRLAIAHALVHNPSILLLDEPTAGLDPVQRLAARAAVKRSARDRVTVVASHLVEDVRALADRVVVFAAGQIAFDGAVDELEARALDDAPGDTPLERAVATLMGAEDAG